MGASHQFRHWKNHHLKPQKQLRHSCLHQLKTTLVYLRTSQFFFGTFRLLLLFKTQHHTLSATPRCRGQVFTGLRVLFWAVVLFGGCMYLVGVVTRTLELRTLWEGRFWESWHWNIPHLKIIFSQNLHCNPQKDGSIYHCFWIGACQLLSFGDC